MDKEVQHQEHGRDQQQQPTSAGRKWSRKERRDKGKKLIKRRDLIVLEWIAQVWAPSAIAVEVERSPKSPKELDAILSELLITGDPVADGEPSLIYTTVWYFVTAHTRRSVEEARDRLPADLQPRVKVLSLETFESLS
jgi:hypothetical protein